MKKTFCLWMLLTSISVNLCAQSKDKTFEVPDYIIFNRKFTINLDNKNTLVIRLSDINDLKQLSNLDSLVQVFLRDIGPLKDSLTDELSAKRIDYVTDVQNRKKIRLLQYPAKGSGFLVDRGGLAALRTIQDTIHLIGILPNPPKRADNTSSKHPRYYHFSFYLNDWSEIRNYLNGELNAKTRTLQENITGKWENVRGSGSHRLQADNSITATHPRGHAAGYSFLAGYITVNAQNCKQYFVPSFSVGLRATLTNKERSFKWVPGVLWEPYFFFSKDGQGKLKTYRNDFVTLIYAQGGTKDHDPRKEFAYSAHFSFSYLVHRSGNYFDRNTFRLGGGQVQFLKTTIEPAMYFNNFFKGVSPSIKISQSF
jgi:hypothetical protein